MSKSEYKGRRLGDEEMIYPLGLTIFTLKPQAEEYSCGGYTLKVSYDKLKDEELLDVIEGKYLIAKIALDRQKSISYSIHTRNNQKHSDVITRVRKFLIRMTHVIPLNDWAARYPISGPKTE